MPPRAVRIALAACMPWISSGEVSSRTRITDSPAAAITSGLPASPGAATGKVVFDADEAEKMAAAGEAVILVREETSPEDIHGMHAAKAILTARGGMTSHAAVVARGMGRPCVSGASELYIDDAAQTFRARNRTFKAGDIITIDGSKGEVLSGAVQMIEPELTGDFEIGRAHV